MTRATRRVSGPVLGCLLLAGVAAAGADPKDALDAAIAAVAPRVIEWRRDLHQHPELSNREVRTAALVADHLRALGLEVRTGIAHTGVVGRLTGGRPGPVVALRADMDALPVTEETGLPFASRQRTEYNGQEVGVMHACGHDAHVAMLMGAAQVLAGIRERLPGSVVFVFQPAEEGPPAGEQGGAALMIEEGLLDGPEAPSAIFGLHVWPLSGGEIFYRPGGTMAAADTLRVRVAGRQTHGSAPWMGIDPLTVAGQILVALQAIPSRQLDVTRGPAVVSIGSIHGGVRHNILPETVDLLGTIRTLDPEMRDELHARIRRTVEHLAAASGATATVEIESNAPVTYNDPSLTERMLPSLAWAAGGTERVHGQPPVMAAEDFAFFQERIPGLYLFLGVNRPGVGADEAPPNHSPRFDVDEAALATGVRALVALAWDYLDGAAR